MSIVRYNSNSSANTDDKSLSIVFKNSLSNSLVLYNSNTNNFELVQLGDKNSSSNSSSNSSNGSHIDPNSNANVNGFICINCGTYNRINNKSNTRHRRTRSQGSNYKQTALTSSIDAITSAASSHKHNRNQNQNQNQNNNSQQHGRIKSFSNQLHSSDGSKYITTSSGDLLSNDYFKLLADSTKNNDGNDNINTSYGNNNISLLTSSVDSDYKIPYELINQGYFKKFFKILDKLGSGSFGSVYKVEHELLGLNLGVFALKKIPIGNDLKNLIKILNEVKFLYNLSYLSDFNDLNNAHVVKYNHVWLEIDQISLFGPKIPVVFLLFEYCDGGTLEDLIENISKPKFDLNKEKLFRKLRRGTGGGVRQGRFLNNFEIFKIFNDIIQGLNYLHGLKIIHRDLKPSNCLFKTKFSENYSPINNVDEFKKIPSLLVSDFGESIMEDTKRESTGATGTLEYCAPELFEFENQNNGRLNEFTYSSDIYSLGMILYYLCFNDLPFGKESPIEIRKEILDGEFFKNIKLNKTRSITHILNDDLECGLLIDWVEFIERLIEPNVARRATMNDIVNTMANIFNKLEEFTEINANLVFKDDISNEDDKDGDDGEFLPGSESERDCFFTDDETEDEDEIERLLSVGEIIIWFKAIDLKLYFISITIIFNLMILNGLDGKLAAIFMNVEYLVLGICFSNFSKYGLCVIQCIIFFMVCLIKWKTKR